MKYLLCLLIVLIALFNLKFYAFAQTTDYVLPYPSFMPGSKLYKFHLVWEKISRYWHFGNLSQFKYNLSQSDKYLIEAKTLFEYKQYLLAYHALGKSTTYFSNAYPFLIAAKREGKNITEKEALFKSAAIKHVVVLNALIIQTPKEFIWSPEFEESSVLNIHKSLNQAIEERDIHE